MKMSDKTYHLTINTCIIIVVLLASAVSFAPHPHKKWVEHVAVILMAALCSICVGLRLWTKK